MAGLIGADVLIRWAIGVGCFGVADLRLHYAGDFAEAGLHAPEASGGERRLLEVFRVGLLHRGQRGRTRPAGDDVLEANGPDGNDRQNRDEEEKGVSA